MNPRAIATKHPPREYPLIAWPNEPQIPAIRSRMSKSSNVMSFSFESLCRPKQCRPKPSIRQDDLGNRRQLKVSLTALVTSPSLPWHFVLEYLPTLHHKSNTFEFSDITKRITCYCHHVCKLARL